ncbi:MAG: hypothetical protein MUF81_00600, partial [Verrucomicrobia bacterium]|nr:hypothetical protein [Verrucomicrobiota bacterium]
MTENEPENFPECRGCSGYGPAETTAGAGGLSKLFRNVLLLTHERMSSCWFVVCGSVPPAGG